jgi:hypothetical protein
MRFNHNGVLGNIDALPGCSQIAVFHSVFVPLGQRRNGLGRVAHKMRLQSAKDLGYDVALCTVDLENEAQISILEENNWKQLTYFTSSKTGHKVGIFAKGV